MPPKPKRFNPGEGLRRKPARASTRNKSQEAPEPQPLSADAALLLEALNSNGNPDARRQDDDRLAVLRDAFEAQEEASEATTTSDHEERALIDLCKNMAYYFSVAFCSMLSSLLFPPNCLALHIIN